MSFRDWRSLFARTVLPGTWFKLVNNNAQDPYLDEIFHATQAQIYCTGRFDVWDPKITTPPGVYLISFLFSPLTGCGLTMLRAQSLLALVLLPTVVFGTYQARGSTDHPWVGSSALSIMLFPPLFFFSSLYYTDVTSTLSVLAFFWFFLHAERNRQPLSFKGPTLILLGTVSLLFRQTNIFWVAIFPAAITLIDKIDHGQNVVKQSMHRGAEGFGDTLWSIARTSFKMGVVYDLPVRDASVEDFVKTICSIAACAAGVATRQSSLSTLFQALSPYLALLALFTTFILWNGGVVLGDKSNHIATLHLPQMLYIWPCITFFSWPLLYPYLLTIPLWLLSKIPAFTELETTLIFRRRQLLPRPWLTAVFVVLACVAVRCNTIVHPFTLADNRHYTFYIFRILTRPAWIKYAATPIYILCGWACIQALGARQPPGAPNHDQAANTAAKPLSLPDGTTPAKTSFVLIWLATSALPLITAPLVEPRYFILPWIFWRLHVPLPRSGSSEPRASKARRSSWRDRVRDLDHRIVVEIAWLLLVNAVTGYVFLNWTFSWPQEPGKTQRFMW